MISVVMSVYNSSKYLKKSIESILEQSFRDFEFIIIDDGSNDGTIDILKKYKETDDRIILLENENNLGLTKNLNIGMALAKYEYIARMDADDISLADRFQKQFDVLEKNTNIDIVGTYCTDINENDIIIGSRELPIFHEAIKKSIVKFNPIIHPTVMFRKSSVMSFGGYNELYRTTQDYALWFDALSHGLRFYNLPEKLLLYRVNDNYLSRKSFKYRLNEYRVRREGYHKNNIFSIYVVLPIILAIIPNSLFWLLKKLDPRNKEN